MAHLFKFSILSSMVVTGGLLISCSAANPAHAGYDMILPTTAQELPVQNVAFEERPSLVISNETMPEVIYNQGSRDMYNASRGYTESNVALEKPFNLIRSHKPTVVTARVDELADEVLSLQSTFENKTARLDTLSQTTEAIARDYYALVAGMNAKLQSGTTPGNPDLVESWDAAQVALNALGETSSDFSALGNEMTDAAARAAVVQENIRSAYLLSGARDEDHENLAILEDQVNDIITRLDRVLNQVNDESNRRTSYLRSERLNMQTLQLAIAKGDLYGENIKNRLFQRAQMSSGDSYTSMATGADLSPMPLSVSAIGQNAVSIPNTVTSTAGKKPLVVIRFDKPNLQYETALYGALSQALERRPDLMLDLVAISPTSQNTAQNALNKTATRKNGESVLRSLTQMGMPMERLALNTSTDTSADYSEVRLYVR